MDNYFVRVVVRMNSKKKYKSEHGYTPSVNFVIFMIVVSGISYGLYTFTDTIEIQKGESRSNNKLIKEDIIEKAIDNNSIKSDTDIIDINVFSVTQAPKQRIIPVSSETALPLVQTSTITPTSNIITPTARQVLVSSQPTTTPIVTPNQVQPSQNTQTVAPAIEIKASSTPKETVTPLSSPQIPNETLYPPNQTPKNTQTPSAVIKPPSSLKGDKQTQQSNTGRIKSSRNNIENFWSLIGNLFRF